MSSGNINKNFKVSVPRHLDSLFLRMINNKICVSDFLTKYKLVAKFLSDEGLAPELVCLFKNGLCQELLHGESLTWDTRSRLFDDDVARLVLLEMRPTFRKKTGSKGSC